MALFNPYKETDPHLLGHSGATSYYQPANKSETRADKPRSKLFWTLVLLGLLIVAAIACTLLLLLS